ncbi:MAG TPA: amino acid permease [Gemmatimonadaceae bacterium]|nr:amino acid permease [Gemmatimonadaceae bacterium]
MTRDNDAPTTLARRLGLFDATMIVMGGIIGAGIFINPSVVARQVHTPPLILTPWIVGGVIALTGAFVYAELADRKPDVGGQYAYIRDAFHPMVAFLYGWTLLLVTQTGGMAAVAMTFALYFRELTGVGLATSVLAVGTLLILTAINCLGVRAGSNVQSALMVLKIVAVAVLVIAGGTAGSASAPPQPNGATLPVAALAAAMVPVLFAYGGWQTASFVSGEMRQPRRDLPRALLIGVLGVVVLYVAVNVVCLHVLGADGLAATTTPASEVMRRVLGSAGARLIAAGIAVSTVGFLSQGMLTAPRVYFAMARDGVFFKQVAYVSERSRAPVVAIAVQGVWASVIAVSGKYEQILNYVVALDAVFFGLTGATLLVFRRREPRGDGGFRMPGHPWTTIVFVAAFWALSVNTIVQNPRSAGIGVLILLAGIPAYLFWSRARARTDSTTLHG